MAGINLLGINGVSHPLNKMGVHEGDQSSYREIKKSLGVACLFAIIKDLQPCPIYLRKKSRFF